MDLMKHLRIGAKYNLMSSMDDSASDVIASFFAWGVQYNMKCLYYVDNKSHDMLEFWLKMKNISMKELIEKGSLIINSAHEYFIEKNILEDNLFIAKLVEDALLGDYKGLAIVADRECFFNSKFSEEFLYNYENNIMNFLGNYPVSVINCYDIDKFGVDAFFALTQLNPNFIYKRDTEVYIHDENNREFSQIEAEGTVYSFLKFRERLVKENKIYSFIGKLSSELPFKENEIEILETAIRNICEATSSNCGMVVIQNDDAKSENLVKFNLPPGIMEAYYNEKNGYLISEKEEFKKSRCLIISASSTIKNDRDFIELLKNSGINNCIFIPLKYDDKDVGLVWLGAESQYVYYKDNCDLLVNACQMLAKIIINYREQRKIQDSMIQASKMNALGELTGGIAHEFNNVLTPIIGFTEILKKEVTASTYLLDLIDLIQSSALDGAKIVKRIQEFTNAKRSDTEIINIDEAIRRSFDITKPKWNIEFKLHNKPVNIQYNLNSAKFVKGISTEIREVFINLITNALDAMPYGGLITVSSYNYGQNVVIKFKDSGVGMDKDVMKRIFQPFFTTKNERGNGLGLAIVYNIIKNMNGNIEVASQNANGAEFTITLPIYNGTVNTKKDEGNYVPANSYRILVIDDQLAVAQTVCEMLKTLGHEVVYLTEEKDVVDVFKKDNFNCVFCDLALKNQSGLELSKIIKQIDSNVKLILMTGWPGRLKSEDIKYIDKMIAKPFSIDDLRKTLNEVLEPKETLKSEKEA